MKTETVVLIGGVLLFFLTMKKANGRWSCQQCIAHLEKTGAHSIGSSLRSGDPAFDIHTECKGCAAEYIQWINERPGARIYEDLNAYAKGQNITGTGGAPATGAPRPIGFVS
mgnify:FL=1